MYDMNSSDLAWIDDVVWITTHTDGVDCRLCNHQNNAPPAVKEDKKILNEYFDVNVMLVSNHSPTSTTATATVMAFVVQWWW